MSGIVLLCGNLLNGIYETLSGRMEILVEGNRIHERGAIRRATAERGSHRSFGPHGEARNH